MDKPVICVDDIDLYTEQLKKMMFSKVFLTDADWEQFRKNIVFKTAKRNTCLLSPNKQECCARLIVNGLIKITHHDPEPYIFDFRIKDNFLCDVVSLSNNTKSNFSFETVTDSEWIETDIHSLMEFNVKISQAYSFLVTDYLNKGHQRTSFLRIGSAEERYKLFCSSHPDIVQYVKQSDIASYLDITTQSLSRIRKNLLKQS